MASILQAFITSMIEFLILAAVAFAGIMAGRGLWKLVQRKKAAKAAGTGNASAE